MFTFIYALEDPITNKIRYVGKSDNPQKRLYAHINRCKFLKTHKDCWLYGLLTKNYKPKLIILEKVRQCEWEKKEQEHISKYENLTNLSIGGASNFGYKHSEKVKEKFSSDRKGVKNSFYGKSHTNETKMKLSCHTKKLWEVGIFYGRKHTESSKKKISQLKKEFFRKNPHKINKPPIMKGKENPSAKERILISPNNEYHVIYNLKKFCNEQNLSYRTLLKNTNKGKILEPTDKKFKDRQRFKSLNTIGWEIIYNS